MNKDDILFRVEKGIATITLNQPEKKNAFNMGMIERWSRPWWNGVAIRKSK